MLKRTTSWVTGMVGSSLFVLLFLLIKPVCADESQLFTTSVQPNILIILDNSNSFDEDFYGNAVGSYSPSSKSVVGRQDLINLINSYINSMQFGLMTFNLPSASKWYLHNSGYFASYNPISYCPNPPPEPGCVDYCQNGTAASQAICQSACAAQNSAFNATYLDAIITSSAVGSSIRNNYCNLVYPKTNAIPNPTDPSNDIYYKMALPFYDSTDDGIGFFYSPSYSPNQYPPYYNTYDWWFSKTGTSDQEIGYSNYYTSTGLVPTDSDYALGFANFGQRLFYYYVGPTWFANSSPGNGYLQVPVNANNPANNNQLNSLLAKLTTNVNNPTGYMSCTNTGNPNQCSYIVNAALTPTLGTLQDAMNYFQGVQGYTSPIQHWCQNNFIILVTDGLPDTDENGNPGTSASLMPAIVNIINNLRNLSVTVSGQPYTFDVYTYVIGVGSEATNGLDAMAVAGGTAVNGQAYYAGNPGLLQQALASVMLDIIEKTYSFTLSSVQATRTTGQDFLYQASFQPVTADPFWDGHLYKYTINPNGSVGSMLWDAGSMLQSMPSTSRNIYTYVGGSNGQITALSSIVPPQIQQYLAVSAANTAQEIVGYIRGDSGVNPDNWKLGDIFHANPITIGSPSAYFTDARSPQAYINFQNANQSRNEIIVVGANDGQFHAFNSSNGSEQWSFIPPNLLPKLQYLAHCSSGVSGCSLLPNGSQLSHTYFVDGGVAVADVWLGSGNGTNKSASYWHTLLVLGERCGVEDPNPSDSTFNNSIYLWNSSPSCDSGFNKAYTSQYPYYCGYYAFDVTNTSLTAPAFKWFLNFSGGPQSQQYLDEPWGKMGIGRVMINGNEKWVGFIGGGYNSDNDPNRGKGFFVVDLSNGNVLWSYTKANNGGMVYSIPASPVIVDTDNDGFIDTAYVGDLGGNMWRFKFCMEADGPQCSTGNWSAGLLFQSSSGFIQPIFKAATITRDSNSLWVFWGTGDEQNPNATSGPDHFFALKDNDRTTVYNIGNLQNISAQGSIYNGTSSGWYLTLPGAGEKLLSDPTVFGGIVMFDTYIPPSGSDPCVATGTSNFYAISMMQQVISGYTYSAGAGVLSPGSTGVTTGGARSVSLGTGLAQTPIVSQNLSGTGGTDLYISLSGTNIISNAQLANLGPNPGSMPLIQRLTQTAPSNQVIHWKDGRVQ